MEPLSCENPPDEEGKEEEVIENEAQQEQADGIQSMEITPASVKIYSLLPPGTLED